MNIGNGTISNTRLRINMIMADSITTAINMNMRISSSMNVNSNMHIDIFILLLKLVSVGLVFSMHRSTNSLLCICNVINTSIRIAIKLLQLTVLLVLILCQV